MTTQNINNVETAGALADADLMLLFRPGQDEEIIKTLASMKAEFAADAAESNILFASASAFVGGEIQLTFGTRLFPSEPDTLLIAFVMPDISSAAATDEVVVTLPLSSSSFRDYTVNDTEVNTLSYSSFETGAVYAMLIRSGGANLIRTDVVSDDSSSDAVVATSPLLVASTATYDAVSDAVILAFGTNVFDSRPNNVLVLFSMPDGSGDAAATGQLFLQLPAPAGSDWEYDLYDSAYATVIAGNNSLTVNTWYAFLLAGTDGYLFKTDLGGSGTAGGTLSNEDPEEITVDGDAAPGDSDEGARINHVHPLQNLRGRVPIAYGTATYSGSRMDIVADGYRHDIADTILVVRAPVAATTAVSPTVINVRVGTNPQQSAIGTTGGSGIPGGTFYPGTYYIWMHTNNQYRLLTAGAHADSRWTSETANGAAATITPEQLRLAIAAHSTGGVSREALLDELAEDPADINGIGSILGTVTDSVTSITLIADSTYADLQVYDVIRVEDELMHITAVTVALRSFDVDRGAFGTDAVQHVVASSVDYVGYGRGRVLESRTWEPSATNDNVFDFGRELLEASDGDKKINVEYSYIAKGVRHYDHWDTSVRHFLRMKDGLVSGDKTHETTGRLVMNAGVDHLRSSSYMVFVYAKRTLTAADETAGYGVEGNTALLIGLRGAAPSLSNFQTQIYLGA